jgi:uncharacterized protein (DUF1015 family)
LTKPKADRLNLLRATQAHCEQIFMLYDDPASEIDNALRQEGPPALEVRDEYDVLHRMWVVSDPLAIAAVQKAMADKKLLIADGHHRYETALNYRNQMRGGAAIDRSAPYERMMMTFVNMDAPGITILPTHRVVFGLKDFSTGEFLAKAEPFFRVTPLASADLQPLTASQGTAFLAVTRDGSYLLQAKPEAVREALAGVPARQAQLDVVQLHSILLDRILGLSQETITQLGNVHFIREAVDAVEMVRSGEADEADEADVAFLIKPVTLDQLRDVSLSGDVMPQKSTDFYPKLLSGLAIYALD